jgi:hypothetical protein
MTEENKKSDLALVIQVFILLLLVVRQATRKA